MSKTPATTLESFLQRQEPAALVAILLELAADHEAVQQRLSRMQMADRPDQLAAGFRKTLAAWRRSTRFHGYGEASGYARQLEAWLEQVERELVPRDPAAAAALFESFIEADTTWFERADDSGGSIGGVMRSACRKWLAAAARCETPASVWPGRLLKLAEADPYGAREELLRRADLLLGEPELRRLVVLFESRMTQALAGVTTASGLPHEVFKNSASLSLLGEALRDPDVKVRAVLSYSTEPNALQREQFVQAYLDADRPSDALAWLQESWGHMESTRQGLLADTLGRLGRFEESAPIRQQMFERTLSVFYLQRWLEHLPEAARPEALSHARQLALDHDDPAVAAVLLLELGDVAGAEERLIAGRDRISGGNYPTLVPLAQALREHECWRGEMAVYRALLTAILDRGYAKAYGHAARYWARLREIAGSANNMTPLPLQEDFEAEVRRRHGRKSAFWAHVQGKRDALVDEEDE